MGRRKSEDEDVGKTRGKAEFMGGRGSLRKGPHKCHSLPGDINGKCQRLGTWRRLGP